jgi:hypothetical protein
MLMTAVASQPNVLLKGPPVCSTITLRSEPSSVMRIRSGGATRPARSQGHAFTGDIAGLQQNLPHRRATARTTTHAGLSLTRCPHEPG